MVSGAGADTIWLFDYAGSFATVTDFSAAQGDRLVLSSLVTQQTLGANTAAAFASAGWLSCRLAPMSNSAWISTDRERVSPTTVMVLLNTLVADYTIGTNVL